MSTRSLKQGVRPKAAAKPKKVSFKAVRWYCDYVAGHPYHEPYHDKEYGWPQKDERVLFERLCLEIFQAGLSWEIVLQKRAGMAKAFQQFEVDRVARYGAPELEKLCRDERIIRNRLKVQAIIHNARVVQGMRAKGGFAKWLSAHHPLSAKDWVTLFKKTFRFTGGEITKEFLLSLGYLPNAHHAQCMIFKKIMRLNPPWKSAQEKGFTYA